MPALRDRFVGSKKAKGLLKGTGAVALLKPAWAKANEIRTGLTPKEKVRVYSVLDIVAYKARVDQEQQDEALASAQVIFWRTVVDEASADGNSVAETWASTHLLTAIAESDTDVLDVGAITLE